MCICLCWHNRFSKTIMLDDFIYCRWWRDDVAHYNIWAGQKGRSIYLICAVHIHLNTNPFIFNDSICYEVRQRRVYHATHSCAGPCSRLCGYVSSLSAFNIHKKKINKKNPDGVLDFSVSTVCSSAQTKSVHLH